MTTESASHSHGLHLIIPTTSAPRAPSESTPKTSTAERARGPNPLDIPGHSHGLFALPQSATDSPIPGHSHGLFRLPAAGPSTPTTPKMSVRAARRSSLFSMHDADEEEPAQHEMADGAAPEGARQELAQLPTTAEADEEEAHGDLSGLKVIGDGSFHVEGDGTGGNN